MRSCYTCGSEDVTVLPYGPDVEHVFCSDDCWIEWLAESDESEDDDQFSDDMEQGPPEDCMSDVEADADTLRSCGWGTDEDYGYFGDDF